MFIRAPPPPETTHTTTMWVLGTTVWENTPQQTTWKQLSEPLVFHRVPPPPNNDTTTVWFHETTVFEMENHSVSPMFIKVPAIKDLTSSEITLKPYKYHSHHKYYRKFVTYWNGGTYTLTLTRFVKISEVVNLSKNTLIWWMSVGYRLMPPLKV